MNLFGQFARDQADNAFRPVITTDQYNLIIWTKLCLCTYMIHQLFGLSLSQLVELFQFFDVVSSFGRMVCGQQVESNTCILHAARGIYAWRQGIGDIALAYSTGLQARFAYQSPQAWIERLIELLHTGVQGCGFHRAVGLHRQWYQRLPGRGGLILPLLAVYTRGRAPVSA